MPGSVPGATIAKPSVKIKQNEVIGSEREATPGWVISKGACHSLLEPKEHVRLWGRASLAEKNS